MLSTVIQYEMIYTRMSTNLVTSFYWLKIKLKEKIEKHNWRKPCNNCWFTFLYYFSCVRSFVSFSNFLFLSFLLASGGLLVLYILHQLLYLSLRIIRRILLCSFSLFLSSNYNTLILLNKYKQVPGTLSTKELAKLCNDPPLLSI